MNDLTYSTTGSTIYHVADGGELYRVLADDPRHAAEQVADGYDLGGVSVDESPVTLAVQDADQQPIATYDAVADLGAEQSGASLVMPQMSQ